MTQHSDGTSAIFAAVMDGDFGGVLSALASGADPTAKDQRGWSPLTWAAGSGSVETVRALLEAGADPFSTGDDDRTPYLVAIAAGRREVARLLAEAEAAAGGDGKRRSSRRHETRPFAKAYHASDLRAFPGWTERVHERDENTPRHLDPALFEPIRDDDLLFLHRGLVVTRSVFADELIVFDGTADGWSKFCRDTLGFRPFDDFDWLDAEGD